MMSSLIIGFSPRAAVPAARPSVRGAIRSQSQMFAPVVESQIASVVPPHVLELPLSLLAAANDFAAANAFDIDHAVYTTGTQGAFGEGLSVLCALAILARLGQGLLVDEDEASTETSSPTTVQPGWLTCDMRVPLPAYKDLETGCHLLNTINGARWWLCAAQEDKSECVKSQDFSEYYGRTVYVCHAQ